MSDSLEARALNVLECISFAISWIVWPISLTTLVFLGFRCYKEKKLIEALPLLMTQFNSALVWGC
jgi:hypothetical protein